MKICWVGLLAGLSVTVLSGAVVGCGSTSHEQPMLTDGKEVIYSFLSQGDNDKADEALDDVWDIGTRAPTVKLSPITWNDNPFDKYWRFIFYGLRPLANLLHAFYTTGNTAYRDKLLDVVRSYNAFEVQRGAAPHPYLDDPHTACFRAMMLVNIYGKLRRTGDLPDDVAADTRASIAKVAAFMALDANFQDHQNHGFNEAAALLTVAVNFPDMNDAALWQQLALSRLYTLSRDTIDDEGVEIENSPFYQFYVMSFVQQDAKWMTKYDVPKPDGFEARIARMFEYATYSTQPDGFVPLLGASVTLNVHKLLPNVYAKDALDQVEGLEDETPGFTFVRELGQAGIAPAERNKRFSVSGQSFMRSGWGNAADYTGQTWVSFNVGNYRSTHNHYDALGITYYANGRALLPDAGLYEYESESAPQPLPTYFRSTRAHNTVVVDAADQPVNADPLVSGGSVVEGPDWLYQSGKHALYVGVNHRRSVVLLKRDLVLVLDALDSTELHDYSQTWHFAADASVVANGFDVTATGPDGQPELVIHQALVAGVELSVLKGQKGPVIQGFYSSKYDQLVPNSVAEYHTNDTRADFATIIASGPYAAAAVTFRANFDHVSDTATATVCVGEVALDVTVVHPSADGEQVTVQPSSDCQ